MRRLRVGVMSLGLCTALAAVPACDVDEAPAGTLDGGSEGGSTSTGGTTTAGTTSATPTATATTSASTDPTATSGTPTSDTASTDPTASDATESDTSIPRDGWVEIGKGLDEFVPFDGELPVTLGPQGFMMFSLPLRGGNFPVPPDPYDFEHPDTPILTVWTDIDGIESEHPSGHFAAFLEYPVPFTLSSDPDVEYEFVSVWLTIPETYAPSELAGREAVVHAELQCSDGQLLVDEHTLTVVDDGIGGGTSSGGLE